MFAATRVMADGKAGLESLPYFVDELLYQGITQLAPWAADHSTEQIEGLGHETRERRDGPWQEIYGMGNGELGPGFVMKADTAASSFLLNLVNPLAAKQSNLADNPAQLAAYCRLNMAQHCRDTLSLWDNFKQENGITENQQLAVVIPFCPEGPTSGTVGMYLGAALRRHFENLGRGNELVIWGIELCPPIDTDETGSLSMIALQNAFRGHVARQELQDGVPLTGDPHDDQRHSPFDIVIVFDGGATTAPTLPREIVWQALDRAAAQTTACLLNGAAGGDVAESTNMLKQGKRWNAYLNHVVSDSAYSSASRYLRYHVRLPWNRDPAAWERESSETKKKAFLERIKEIRPLLDKEKDASVKEMVKGLIRRAEEVDAIKSDNAFVKLFTRDAQAKKDTELVLDYAMDEDRRAYQETHSASAAPAKIIPKSDPFCVNIALPEELRRKFAERMRDSDVSTPITDLLGTAGILNVRERIQKHFQDVLERSDSQSPDINSQAFFENIIAISIEDRGNANRNEGLRPTREFLSYFIEASHHDKSGAFNPLSYDLHDKIRSSGPDDANQPKALWWQPARDVHYDIPVEYSFLALARCRAEDGFRDISAHDALQRRHDELVADLELWRENARYYGVKPPAGLVDSNGSLPPVQPDEGDPGGAFDTTQTTNGYRGQPDFVEKNA